MADATSTQPESRYAPVLDSWYESLKTAETLYPQTMLGRLALTGNAVLESLNSGEVSLPYVQVSRLTDTQVDGLTRQANFLHSIYRISTVSEIEPDRIQSFWEHAATVTLNNVNLLLPSYEAERPFFNAAACYRAVCSAYREKEAETQSIVSTRREAFRGEGHLTYSRNSPEDIEIKRLLAQHAFKHLSVVALLLSIDVRQIDSFLHNLTGFSISSVYTPHLL